jgi:hypothetical protein
MIPEWANEIERTEYVDEIFSRIGRLLHKANSFESYCKGVSTMLDLKSNPGLRSEENGFEAFLKKIEWKSLGKYIETAAGYFQNQSLTQILKTAKEARNEIAHELTLSLEHVFGNQEAEKRLEAKILDLAKKVVVGEYICIGFTASINKEEPPNLNYLDRTMNWILDK